MKLSALKWPLLMLVICAGFFWKLVLTNQYSWLDSPDYAYQVLPWYQFQAGEWHEGRMPLWDPNLWGGQPLVGQMITGAAYPPNWLLFLMPLRKGWIRQPYLHWYFVLIHFQAVLFCYWLCRDLGRSRAASLLAGLAFGLGGFMGTNGWPQMLNGAVWAPLVMLFFLRAMRGVRPVSSSAWSGVFLGLAFLSGHHQIPIFLCLAMAGAWIYYVWLDSKNWKLLGVFGVFVALVSALQVLPGIEYGKLAIRWAGAVEPQHWNDKLPYYVHRGLALAPESVLGIVVPGIYRGSDPFIGLVALTLALLGLSMAWKERVVRLFAAMSLGGLLFAMGPSSAFHGVIYSLVPMVDKARSGSMAILIFHLGVVVLLAYGIDSYESIKSRWHVWTLLGFSALVGATTLVLLAIQKPGDDRLGMVVLVGLALAAILTAWQKAHVSSRAATTFLVLLLLLELGNVTTYGMPSQVESKTISKQLSEHADIAEFLRSQDQPVRVEIDEADVPYNFGDWYGIDHFGGYLASMTENVSRVQANTRARMMYATNYHVGKKPSRGDQIEVYASPSGLKVYRNPGAFPRTWVVHEALPIQRDDQIAGYLESKTFDPRRQTLVRGAAPPLEKCDQPEPAMLIERQSGHMVIEAQLACRGMVIDAETYFPGWEATVDGKPAQVYEAYGFLRGVVAEAGWHRIEMRYRPKSVYLGGALTLLGLLGAVLLQRRVE